MSNRSVRSAMTSSAVCFAALGLLLLFAPQEAGALLGQEASHLALHQLLGAALLGFASMNWVARGSALGGIYGRAVIAGNQTHLTVGALLLVKNGLDSTNTQPAYWAIAGIYVVGAACFVYLTFFSSGIERRP
jgi:hypothetical protein